MFWLATVLAFAGCHVTVPSASTFSNSAPSGKLEGRIVDAETGKVIHARVYVTDSHSNHYFDPRGVVFKHRRDNEQNFSCDGKFEVELPAGEATIRIERGLEYRPLIKTIRIAEERVCEEEFPLERWVNLSKEGWYSGDLHGHRDLEEMRTLVLAEDVNVASVITRHNQWDYWKSREHPESKLSHIDDTHVISQFDEEVEYLGKDTLGALIFIGIKQPIVISNSNAAYPTLAQYADECHEMGGFVDAEKPIWLGVAVSAALGQIDSIGIVNNHFHPRSFLPCVGRWGEIVPEQGFEAAEGLALWCMELYYRLLNCGFRIPVSAGTASGIMPSPVGYSRVYVRLPGEFSYGNWVKGLKAGRSFATNGPVLSLKVSGREIGDVLKVKEPPITFSLEAEAKSIHPLAYLEIVANGKIVGRAEARKQETFLSLTEDFSVTESTWIAARAFEKNDETARFAHTSPVYVEVAGKPLRSPKAGAYYRKNMDRVIEFTEGSTLFESEEDRQTALAIYRKARQTYADIETRAPATPK